RLIALVHHPLSLETGLSPERARAMFESERAALAFAHGVITTSRATARTLPADFSVPPSRIAVVEPGTDPAPLAAGTRGKALSLLCVGSVTPRKGHRVLI